MVYLIVRRRKNEYTHDYRIEKWAPTIKEANKYLSALSLLDDDEDVMFFIVPAQENPALVLTETDTQPIKSGVLKLTEEVA